MGHYENGKKVGVWSFYDEQGKKIADEIYKNDKVTTKFTSKLIAISSDHYE